MYKNIHTHNPIYMQRRVFTKVKLIIFKIELFCDEELNTKTKKLQKGNVPRGDSIWMVF